MHLVYVHLVILDRDHEFQSFLRHRSQLDDQLLSLNPAHLTELWQDKNLINKQINHSFPFQDDKMLSPPFYVKVLSFCSPLIFFATDNILYYKQSSNLN